jgi:hypothetical protein
MSSMQENLKLRKIVDYLSGTTKSEPKMWKNLKLRNFLSQDFTAYKVSAFIVSAWMEGYNTCNA